MKSIRRTALLPTLSCLIVQSCASPTPKAQSLNPPASPESGRFENYLENSRQKSEYREQQWKNYSRRADENYSNWIDKMMEL